jgi:hypothetical protein
MTTTTPRPLPTALFLALIPVGWLSVTVVVTGLEGLVGIFPSRFAAAFTVFHQASPSLLAGWGATALMAAGAFLTRNRRPFTCALFVALFLVGYVTLAPVMYQRLTFGVWIAYIDAMLAVAGIWQLMRDDSAS